MITILENAKTTIFLEFQKSCFSRSRLTNRGSEQTGRSYTMTARFGLSEITFVGASLRIFLSMAKDLHYN